MGQGVAKDPLYIGIYWYPLYIVIYWYPFHSIPLSFVFIVYPFHSIYPFHGRFLCMDTFLQQVIEFGGALTRPGGKEADEAALDALVATWKDMKRAKAKKQRNKACVWG